jgi:hypothetical protein
LGTWSIDVNNENSMLESETGAGIPVAVVGYKLSTEHEVKPISELEFEAKQLKKEVKQEAKAKRAEQKMISNKQLIEYRRKINQMDMDTLIKVRERQKYLKSTKVKSNDGVTDNLGTPDNSNNDNEKE